MTLEEDMNTPEHRTRRGKRQAGRIRLGPSQRKPAAAKKGSSKTSADDLCWQKILAYQDDRGREAFARLVRAGFPAALLRKRLLELPGTPVPKGVPSILSGGKFGAPSREFIRQLESLVRKSEAVAEKVLGTLYYEHALLAAAMHREVAQGIAKMRADIEWPIKHGFTRRQPASLSYPAHLELSQEANRLTGKPYHFDELAVLIEAVHHKKWENEHFQQRPAALKQQFYQDRRARKSLERLFRWLPEPETKRKRIAHSKALPEMLEPYSDD
jgi:hypothetical protein